METSRNHSYPNCLNAAQSTTPLVRGRPGFVAQALLLLIWVYRGLISPFLVAWLGPGSGCRHQPTCSLYAKEAVERFGAGRGSWLALRRLMRCHPWGTSGDDPVPQKLEGL